MGSSSLKLTLWARSAACDRAPCHASIYYCNPVSKAELHPGLCWALKLIFLMKIDCSLCNVRSYMCGIIRCQKCLSSSTAFKMVVSCLYLPLTDLEFSEDTSGVLEGNKKSTNKQGDKSKENTRKIFSGPKRVSNNAETNTKFLFYSTPP